jgi:hypothetical protein
MEGRGNRGMDADQKRVLEKREVDLSCSYMVKWVSAVGLKERARRAFASVFYSNKSLNVNHF